MLESTISTIDLGDLSDGMYLVKINNKIHKLIINK